MEAKDVQRRTQRASTELPCADLFLPPLHPHPDPDPDPDLYPDAESKNSQAGAGNGSGHLAVDYRRAGIWL